MLYGTFHRRLRRLCKPLLTVVLAAVAFCRPAVAEPFEFTTTSTDDRQQMFAELARDVESLDRELGIYGRVARLLSPSVVHIESTPLRKFQSREDIEEAGSGVLVRLDGKDYVLTNWHVIKHSQPDLIRLDLQNGQQLRPKQIWGDMKTDVGIMSVEGRHLVPARIGDSDQAEIGQIVLAFGSPFNLRHSVTRGIISAMDRCNLDLGEGEVIYQRFMQTDAAINPGNSGGPLVNLRGEVIGMNTAIASNSGGNEGIGFSIPINIAVRIVRQLIETGRVERGLLGVILAGDYDDQFAREAGLPKQMGARVKDVSRDSPAELAGLQENDIILRYDGTPIEDDDHLISLVKLTENGRNVELDIYRQHELLTKQVRIAASEE